MTAVVTIGIPIYRGKLFLEESLASVQSQTFRQFEAIMSLDGPDAECEEICQTFLRDSRFRLVVQPQRLGWMDHTNRLMAQVVTEFWHLQEQDDVIAPEFLETLIDHARRHLNTAAVYSDVRTFGIFESQITMSPVVGSAAIRQLKLIHEHFQGVAPLGLIRTDALRLSGGLQPNLFENFAADTALMAGLARWGELHRVPAELYHKRVHAGSTHATWWEWPPEVRFKAWQTHCLDLLRQAIQIESTARDRGLIWLALIRRLLPALTGCDFIPVGELTMAQRTEMLDSFLRLARDSPLDISRWLLSDWVAIERLSADFYWLGASAASTRASIAE